MPKHNACCVSCGQNKSNTFVITTVTVVLTLPHLHICFLCLSLFSKKQRQQPFLNKKTQNSNIFTYVGMTRWRKQRRRRGREGREKKQRINERSEIQFFFSYMIGIQRCCHVNTTKNQLQSMFIFFPWRINIYLSNNGIIAKCRHCCESLLDEREIRVAGRTKEAQQSSIYIGRGHDI